MLEYKGDGNEYKSKRKRKRIHHVPFYYKDLNGQTEFCDTQMINDQIYKYTLLFV